MSEVEEHQKASRNAPILFTVIGLVISATLAVFQFAKWIGDRGYYGWSDFAQGLIESYRRLFPDNIARFLNLFWDNWPAWTPDALLFVSLTSLVGNGVFFLVFRQSIVGRWRDIIVEDWGNITKNFKQGRPFLAIVQSLNLFIFILFAPMFVIGFPIFAPFGFLSSMIVAILFFWWKSLRKDAVRTALNYMNIIPRFLLGYGLIVFLIFLLAVLDQTFLRSS